MTREDVLRCAEHIDNIVEDLTQSAAADALLGACATCSHPNCERKRQAERDTRIAGQELAEYIATLRAKLQAVQERVHKLPIDCYGDANSEDTDVLLARRDCVLAALEGDNG